MSRRTVTGVLVLALILSAALNLLGGEPARGTAPSETVLDRLPIAKNAAYLLVPVEIKGKRYRFAVDTGASGTVYDSSLRPLLGEQVGLEKVRTPNGDIIDLPLFQPPIAKIGKLPLPQNSPVAIADLEKLRQVGGEELYGILGMDFLSKHILRIDFDSSEVVFLRSIGPNPGERLPLTFRHGLPHVPMRIAGKDDPELFLLDTGWSGYGSGHMRAELFDEMIQKQKISSLMRIRAANLSRADLEQQQGRIESISLADHRHKRLLFARSKNNILALPFCSRYVMTFDFDNGLLYLKKGRRFDWPDKQNLSGLHTLRVKGETRVAYVDKGSPAAAAGVQPSDVLLMVNGEKVSGIAIPVLRDEFCLDGKQIRLLVRRGTEEREVSFVLPNTE